MTFLSKLSLGSLLKPIYVKPESVVSSYWMSARDFFGK